MLDYSEVYAMLKKYGQEHILQFYPSLTTMQQEALLKSIQSINFSLLPLALPAYTNKVNSNYSVLDACDINEITHNKETYEEDTRGPAARSPRTRPVEHNTPFP